MSETICRDCHRRPVGTDGRKGRCYPCYRAAMNAQLRRYRARVQRKDVGNGERQEFAPTGQRWTGYGGAPCGICRTPTNQGHCLNCGTYNRGAA